MGFFSNLINTAARAGLPADFGEQIARASRQAQLRKETQRAEERLRRERERTITRLNRGRIRAARRRVKGGIFGNPDDASMSLGG